MTGGSTDPAPPPAAAGEDNSIGHLFSRLIDDAERFVRAEINLYRAQALSRVGAVKTALVMLVLAFLIAQSAIIALLVGLVVIVRQYLHSAALATVTVVGSALLVAAILVGIAVARIKAATRVAEGPK